MIRSFWNRHIQNDLRVRLSEWNPVHIFKSFHHHSRFSTIRASVGQPYNIIQKISYIGVIFILLPLMIFTGLAMSPAMGANWSLLTDIFGGRQSARSIHFIAAFSLLLFFLIHMIMVLMSGPFRQLKSMIAGGEKREKSE